MFSCRSIDAKAVVMMRSVDEKDEKEYTKDFFNENLFEIGHDVGYLSIGLSL